MTHDDDHDLTALFTTPQIHTDEHGVHRDGQGREYVAVVVGGETTYEPARRKSPKENLRWHLAMKYHIDAYPGHGTEKTDTCYECGQIEALVREWQSAVLDSLARKE